MLKIMRRMTRWVAGVVLALGATQASASLNFDVVGDVLWDRDTGYAWRQVTRTGYPATLELGGGWRYASLSAFADMLPDPGTYAGDSGAARALGYFDPLARGYLFAWLTHGTGGGYPLFDGHSYLYVAGGNGSVVVSGWGLSTIGDYNAGYCVDPSGPFAPACDRPQTFMIVNTEWPGAVPLPASGLLLAGGLLWGAVGAAKRRPRRRQASARAA